MCVHCYMTLVISLRLGDFFMMLLYIKFLDSLVFCSH